MMNYYSLISDYSKVLEKRIQFLESKQKNLPAGNLKIEKRQGFLKYSVRSCDKDRKCSYLSRKQKEKIVPYANKKYMSEVLSVLRKNRNAAMQFLQLHSKIEEDEIAETLPDELKDMNGNLYTSKRRLIEIWQKKPYIRNEFHSEELIHDTIRGEKMRSKSEVMIANTLNGYFLPYKPEVPVRLKNGRTAYPDFFILDPRTMKEYYWEHFGRMDDPEYAAEVCRKLRMYDESGIMIGKNLICTFESSETPLSSVVIENIIKYYFKSDENL